MYLHIFIYANDLNIIYYRFISFSITQINKCHVSVLQLLLSRFGKLKVDPENSICNSFLMVLYPKKIGEKKLKYFLLFYCK